MFAILDREKVKEVLSANNRAELCIAVCCSSDFVNLIMADFSTTTVPCFLIYPSGDGTSPDFLDIDVTDYGLTVKFGKYEAAVDALLESGRLYSEFLKVLKWDEGWFLKPNPAFDNEIPLNLIKKGKIEKIFKMLYDLKSGAAS